MDNSFEIITSLQYENKSLKQQLRKFKTGEAYVEQREYFHKELSAKDRMIAKLKRELAQAHAETVTVRKYWSEVFDDVYADARRDYIRECKEKVKMEERAIRAERQRDETLDKYRDLRREMYAMGAELEAVKGENLKLRAQVNKDFRNSSLTSAQQGPARKKIPNSRVKTGRKPGAQQGHEGHCRKRHEPTESHEIPVPEEYRDGTAYAPTGRVLHRQKVCLGVNLRIIDYYTEEYREKKTGHLVHAGFPEGFENDVNYDGSVKAFAFLLANGCNVSHDKVRTFLSEVTNGKLNISKGMINGLCKEFSKKTDAEKSEIAGRMMQSPVMNADFTNANINGKPAQVLICASPMEDLVLFVSREKKGHEGIRGTILENYVGTICHDHDVTFYAYGLNHQECMQHNLRYLKGSMENEPDREWNREMHGLLQEMIHLKNESGENLPEQGRVARLEQRYDEILAKAASEYENVPPGEYYREGYNLYKRLSKYKKSQLLFLHDEKVPSNNSLCERNARVHKRKQRQAMVFRSYDNHKYLCEDLSVMHLLRTKNDNLYEAIRKVFDRCTSSQTINTATVSTP